MYEENPNVFKEPEDDDEYTTSGLINSKDKSSGSGISKLSPVLYGGPHYYKLPEISKSKPFIDSNQVVPNNFAPSKNIIDSLRKNEFVGDTAIRCKNGAAPRSPITCYLNAVDTDHIQTYTLEAEDTIAGDKRLRNSLNIKDYDVYKRICTSEGFKLKSLIVYYRDTELTEDEIKDKKLNDYLCINTEVSVKSQPRGLEIKTEIESEWLLEDWDALYFKKVTQLASGYVRKAFYKREILEVILDWSGTSFELKKFNIDVPHIYSTGTRWTIGWTKVGFSNKSFWRLAIGEVKDNLCSKEEEVIEELFDDGFDKSSAKKYLYLVCRSGVEEKDEVQAIVKVGVSKWNSIYSNHRYLNADANNIKLVYAKDPSITLDKLWVESDEGWEVTTKTYGDKGANGSSETKKPFMFGCGVFISLPSFTEKEFSCYTNIQSGVGYSTKEIRFDKNKLLNSQTLNHKKHSMPFYKSWSYEANPIEDNGEMDKKLISFFMYCPP